jgi:hypothetical protein
MSTPISDAEAVVISAIKEEGRRAKLSLAHASEIRDFGGNEQTLRYLDEFIDTFRQSNAVDAESILGYTQMLACVVGDMLIAQYGGQWRAVGKYYLELNTPSHAIHKAYPFPVVEDRITKAGSMSLFDYYFKQLPADLELASQPVVVAVAPPVAAPEHPMLQTIRKHTTFVTQYIGHKFGLPDFGPNAHSIGQLDAFIDLNVSSLSPEAAKEKYMNMLGAFLGQSIVAVYNAQWKFDARGVPSLEIVGADGSVNILDPYAKVAKRIENGNADNLAFYFQQLIPQALASQKA